MTTTQQINEWINANAGLLGQLYGRWLDEREHEGLIGYQSAIQRAMPAGFRITQMTKRPFGFRFIVDGSQQAYAVEIKARRIRALQIAAPRR